MITKNCEVCKNPLNTGKQFCSYKCRRKRITKQCLICNGLFETLPYRIKQNKGKFCSKKCYGMWQSSNRIGKKAANWKSDKVGYGGVHYWIASKKGYASKHECVFKDKTCKGKMNWSNISHKYYRAFSDWQVLCNSHNQRYDYTDEKRIKISKSIIKWWTTRSPR